MTQSNRKRGTAITGDRFTVVHPNLALENPFSSFVDVEFDGLVHQVLSMQDGSGTNFVNTTGQFTVAGLDGLIVESLDTVATQVAHRYKAVVTGPTGVLMTQSYDSPARAIALIGALAPETTPLGMAIAETPELQIVGPPKVAMSLEIGVVEVTPLTEGVIAQLPDWAGTTVSHGELYAGRFSDETPYLTLVTDTARVVVMVGDGPDAADDGAHALAEMDARWRSRPAPV